jgi:hypothetical protein
MNEKAIKAGWKFKGIHPIIGIEWACRNVTGNKEVMFEDKVYYNPQEVEIVTKNGGLTENIHNVKKIFGGVVIK